MLLILRLAGFDGMVGQDSYAYVDYGNAIKHALLTSTHPGDFAWPQGYPLLGTIVSFIGISVGTALQLISALSLSISLIIVYKIIREIYPDTSTTSLLIYLILFGIFSPYYLRNGMLTMSDTLSCCLVIASLYFGYLYTQKQKLLHLTFFVMVSSFSLFVRYPSALVLVPVAIFVLYTWVKSIRKPLHFIVLIVPVLIYLLHTYFEQNTTGFLNHEAINFWNIKNYFSSTFTTNQGTFNFLVPNLIFVFSPLAHYGFMLLGLPFLFLLVKQKQFVHTYIYLSVTSFLVYALFVAGIDTQNARHLLLLYPLVLVLGFYGFNYLYNLKGIKKYRVILISLGFVFQLALCALAFKTIFIRNNLEQYIAKTLENYDNKTLYGFDIDIALNSRGVPQNIVNLWYEEYTDFEKGALVLFNEERFKTQWEGENPMINWNNLKQNYTLTELEEFNNNWKLYIIE